MAKKVQLMTNPKQWQVIDGVEVLVDVPQEDIDPITDSSCVEIEGHRTLEEIISQDNMFTPEIVETKVHSKVGGVYHDNVVDSAYEEAILYGNTQVNLVEPVTSGTKYIPHSFTSFQGNEGTIGNYNSGKTNQVAPLVKGVTMVNLCQETSAELAQEQGLWVENVKGNTKYTIMFDFPIQNTLKGVMIQSYSLDTMLEISSQKVSLGERANYTFTTHADTTHIKILNSGGYGGETIQLDNIMVIEGDVTDLDLSFFKGMRSVELSRPLTNLFTDDLVGHNQGAVTYTNLGGNVTVTSNSIQSWSGVIFYLGILKPNTKYLVMWDSLNATQTSSNTESLISIRYGEGGITESIAKINNNELCPTLRSMVFDTQNYDVSRISLCVYATLSNSETGTTSVAGLRVFEWDDSLRTLDLQTIGYFSGTKYVSAPRTLEAESKNLYLYGDVSFISTNTDVDSWYDHKGTTFMQGDIALKSQSRFLLKQGTYTITTGIWVNVTTCQLIDDKEQIIIKLDLGQRNHIFTLSQDTYCTLRIKASVVNTVTQIPNIQIERGETVTTYEAYQGRYYKPRETEEIVLRSLPNGVYDTFNLQTGELVQNIGEVVLDGSEDWWDSPVAGQTFKRFRIIFETKRNNHNQILICDRILSVPNSEWDVEREQIEADGEMLSIRKTFDTLEDFKTWLSNNPVTVQYQLAKPIITKLQTYNRIYDGQTNALVDMDNNLSALTYYSNNYYLKVGNLSPIPSIIEPITSVPYNVRLKPITLYTVKYNRGGNSDSMKFDLGGSIVEKTNSIADLTGMAEEFTVRTPAILSHEQLILSGTGFAHNFIIVEGDITGTELPYFEGMKDVKMPIVKNIGKNLFNPNIIGDSGQYIRNDRGSLVEDMTSKYTVGYVCVKPNTEYYLYVKGLQRVYFLDNNKKWISRTNILYQQETQTYTTNTNFTTGSNCHYIQIQYRVDELDLTNATLVEYGDNNHYVNYKENSVYVVQGEIPFSEDMFEQGTVLWTTQQPGTPLEGGTGNTLKYDANNRIRLKGVIPAKPNSQYALVVNDEYDHLILPLDVNKCRTDYTNNLWVNEGQHIITTTNDTQYLTYVVAKQGAAVVPSDFSKLSFHMYELDSTINLRSLPNGVKDELNLLTGEYIQRVGEVVLDGSEDEDWQVAPSHTGGVVRMETLIITGLFPNTVEYNMPNIVNNKYNVHTFTDIYQGKFSNAIGVYTNTHIVVQDNEYADVDTFKQHLQSNPITVQYELAEPIISHVRLVSNNQEREVGVKLPNGVCNTYNPSTGITTVRVGKVVLDGSENWILDTTKTNTQVFELPISDMMVKVDNNVVCDSLPLTNGSNSDTEKIASTQAGGDNEPTWGIYIALLKTKASTVDELKTYLALNPITVWYQLKYPQIQPDIVLPNGVHDEYNPETGAYTKKVGFIEFDGSADEFWFASTWVMDDVMKFDIVLDDLLDSDTEKYVYSNMFNTVTRNFLVDETQRNIEYISNNSLGYVSLSVAKTKLNTQDLQGFKLYLAQNPVKVWYQLQTPVTYQLTPYFGLPQPYAYEDGHLIHDSAYAENTLPPEFKYKLVANRTGQVMQNNRKLKEHTARLSDLEALIIEATIESLFNRELQLFELELMDIQLIDLGE